MASSSNAAKTGFHYAYLIVLSCIAITCLPCALVLSCAGIFFTPVSVYFGVARAQFTLYFSILNIAMMATLPVAGKLLAQKDARLVLSICVALCGLGMFGMAACHEIWQFYIVGAVLGVGVAPLIYLVVPTLINAWCQKRVGFFVGLCMAFTGIGGVIFNPIGTSIIQSGPEGWRSAYSIFAVIILVGTLPFTLFVVRSRPTDKGLLPYGAEDAAAASSTRIAPEATGIMAADAMHSPAFWAIVASAAMGGQAIGKVFLGTVSDRSVKLGSICGVAAGVAGILIMWGFPSVLALLLVGAFLFGVVYAMTTVETPLMVRSVFGSKDYANIYSRVSMVGSFMSAIAAVFWSLIIDSPGGYPLMFILSLVCMATCLALACFALAHTPEQPQNN
ncbi:MAG: MFS transporter [Atopobium sp.]|nr:MFS transporter [Atopobium sp.]RRF98822.1 MAG: MFS transporter [Coriobacteriaceae bacterium]